MRLLIQNTSSLNRSELKIKKPLVLFCMLAFVVVLQPSNFSLPGARSTVLNPIADEDNDALPDAFEAIYGTSSSNPDNDGDGVLDGIEYVLGSNPLDPADCPVLTPGIRIAPYHDGDVVKLCMIFFPGEVKYINSFSFHFAYSQNFAPIPGKTGLIDLTGLIPFGVKEFSFVVYQGLLVTSYVVDFPDSLLEKYSPVSIGISSQIIGVSLFDILDINYIDGIPVMLIDRHELDIGGSGSCYIALTGDLPQGWCDDEVCKTDMIPVSSSDGVIEYEITDAECDSLMKKLCSPSDCSALEGTRVVTIDPGFLIGDME